MGLLGSFLDALTCCYAVAEGFRVDLTFCYAVAGLFSVNTPATA